MLFWTKREYQRFSDAMMDKPMSYYAFQVLYWCGIRVGEAYVKLKLKNSENIFSYIDFKTALGKLTSAVLL